MFVCLVGFLLVIQAAGGASHMALYLLIDAGFVTGLLILSEIFGLVGPGRRWAWPAIGLIGATVAAGLYALNRNTLAAWVLIIGAYAWLARIDRPVAAMLLPNRAGRWITRSFLAIAGGFLPVLISQVESRFADEEFFALVQAIELAGFCLLYLSGQAYLQRDRGEVDRPAGRQARLGLLVTTGGLVSATIGLLIWGVVVYQSSFYTPNAPRYPGLTETSPFLCGWLTPDPQRPSGKEVYRRLLTHIEANPRKGVPELGMLALGTGEARWAEAFRDAILTEARTGRFTEPANSVKFGQHEAALRAYYAPRVRAAFPDLFSAEDWETLRAWFAAINRRALTPEWVDGMYALAFSKWPEGPYENQENGAGLLAILEVEGLSPSYLSSLNQAYLERNKRGWLQRFHNTDDAFIYQAEWITNAYFQWLYWRAKVGPGADPINRQLSFEWMLLQGLPDGYPLGYNHPGRLLPAGTAYLAASLERDPRFLWWSAQMLEWATENNAALHAQPGVESALNFRGISPAVGSCLIYSNSGLPNQPGPLAPDKLVFRDGWTRDSAYMLLNLRFSGWHRYKATNDVVLLYQDGPIVVEKGSGNSFGWLPAGRSLSRDKRVPRENLNGLLVPRTGWSQVVHRLSGFGGNWAQDPPTYAHVESVDWSGPVDVSRTVVDDWRGWMHTRTVYFVHRGPVIVIDSARGEGQAAIVWHLVGEGCRDENSLWLRDGPSPARMVLSPEAWRSTSIRATGTALQNGDIGAPNWDVMYSSPVPGKLDLVTAFALGPWALAQHEIEDLSGGQFIEFIGPNGRLTLLQNDTGQWMQAKNLATDGSWALTLEQEGNRVVCFAGGTHTRVSLQVRPAELRDAEGRVWSDWDWDGNSLTLHNAYGNPATCLNVLR